MTLLKESGMVPSHIIVLQICSNIVDIDYLIC